MSSKIGILGTIIIVFIILLMTATVMGYNVFDLIKQIIDRILDTFKVLFSFERPEKENPVRIMENDIKIQNVEVKPFDSPDLAVKLPVEIDTKRQVLIAEKEIPMTDEDRTIRKMQEIKNEKNESHVEIELPKPTPIQPVRRSLDRSIQVRSYLTDEDKEYIETFNSGVSKFNSIEVNSYDNSGVTSKVYPSQMNCMKPNDLDDIPTTYYKLFQA